MLLTSGTSLLAVAAIAAAMLVPRDADPLPARDLGPLALLSEDAAMEQARSSGTPVVATALTTSTTKITARPDGMFDAEISPMPVRVLDAEGVWHDIDNTLVRRADGSIGPARPGVNMAFSDGGSEPLAALADTGRSLALTWPTVLPEPTLVGTAAHYESVVPGVDLVARAGTTGFSTYVVVHTPEAAQHPLVRDLAFEIDAVGVQVSDTRGGTVVAKEGTEAVFRASQPLAWDSSEAAGPAASSSAAEEEAVIGAPLSAPVESETVPMTVEASNTSLELAPKSDLLTDPDTTWPVVLDPGFTTGGVGDQIQRWGMVWSNGTNFYDHPTEDARVGYDGWSSAPKKSRVFYRFNTAPIVGKKIHLAQLQHSLIHTPNNDCNLATYGPNVQVWRTGVIGSTLSWSNQPAWIEQQDADNLAHGNEQYCTGADQQNFNVRAMIRDIAAAGETSANIGMKSGDETDKNGWRRYNNSGAWPRLYVAYSHTPAPPAALALTPSRDRGTTQGIWTNTLNPALSANVSAPNGGTAYVRFEIWSGASMLWAANSGSGGNGTSVTTTVPSGKLGHGGTYTLKAYSVAPPDPNYAADGLITSAPSSVTFRVDIEAPPAPKVVKAAGMCRVSVRCYFDFTPQSTDTVAYRYSLNTDSADGPPAVGVAGQPLQAWVVPQSFGPGWLVAAAEDLAGNISSKVEYVDNVKIHGSVMGHHWNLDGTGADQVPSTAPHTGAALYTPTLPTAAGRLGTLDWTGTVPDATDRALDVSATPGRAASLVEANHNAGQDFSVSAWVKLPTSGTADGVVLSQRAQAGNYDAWILGYSSGYWYFRMSSGNTWYTAYLVTAPPRGQWIHIAGLFDYHRLSEKRQLSLFIDGREVAEVPFQATPHAWTKGLWVGAGTSSSGPDRAWPGSIDDVRTFPGVLDASQIRRIIAEHRRS